MDPRECVEAFWSGERPDQIPYTIYRGYPLQSGVLGDPSKASREKGEKYWGIMIRNLVEFVEDLKGMSLDEIYQRRY